MTVLQFLEAISPVLLGLAATLPIAVALLRPRHIPACGATTRTREVPLPR